MRIFAGVFVGVLAGCATAPPKLPVKAAEYVWIDHPFVWDAAHGFDPTPRKGPENWTSPIDYAHGQMQVRLVVKEKADATPVWLEVCLWQEKMGGPKHTCINCLRPAWSTPGTYTCQTSPAEHKGVDWSQPFVSNQIRIKDGSAGRGKDLARLGVGLPIRARYQVVLVPAGQAFSGWQSKLP